MAAVMLRLVAWLAFVLGLACLVLAFGAWVSVWLVPDAWEPVTWAYWLAGCAGAFMVAVLAGLPRGER